MKQPQTLTGVMLSLITLLLAGSLAMAEEKAGDLKLLDWKPVSQLVVKETRVLQPKFKVIDIHNHLRGIKNAREYLKAMDDAGVWKCVSLDGMSKGDQWQEQINVYHELAKDRFLIFFSPNFENIDDPDYGIKEANNLERAVKAGCSGVKIFKDLGLVYRDKSGKLIAVDDPRIDPIWAKAGELGVPVMIHVSDPKAFFTPLDEHNERYDELGAHPHWLFYGDQFPGKEEILAQRNRVVARHPETIFIGAHVGNLPEELARVGDWLDTYPNFYVDIDARIAELGRQPRTARKFLVRYQDKVMFGTDTPPVAEAYRTYYRFLETDDEYFDPSSGHHPQGRWMIYGVHLPDEVLEKIYYKNAEKILSMKKM